MPLIETERVGDRAFVRAVNLAAFPTPVEADLVDRLRANGRPIISLVARAGDLVAGHVLFSPVTINAMDGDQVSATGRGLGLAPVAVVPEFQGRGIGSALIATGLVRCRESGVAFVVVVGDPHYYSRFGFEPASRYRLNSEYDVGDAFQVLLFDPAALPAQGGLVRYGVEFAGLS